MAITDILNIIAIVGVIIALWIVRKSIFEQRKNQDNVSQTIKEIKTLYERNLIDYNEKFNQLQTEFVKEQIRGDELFKQKETFEHRALEYKKNAQEHYDQFLLCREKNLKLKRENDILKNIMKQTYNKCGVELQNFIEQQLNNTNIIDVVGKEEEGE
jgi:hypothetical protein